MSGAVLRKRRRGEPCGFVRKPGRAIDELRITVRPAPCANPLTDEEVADGGDWPHGGKHPLVIPAANAGVEDSVGESKEQLDVSIDSTLAVAVMVSASHELCEQIPMSGRQLGVRPVRPVFRDHLVLVGKTAAQFDQCAGLG